MAGNDRAITTIGSWRDSGWLFYVFPLIMARSPPSIDGDAFRTGFNASLSCLASPHVVPRQYAINFGYSAVPRSLRHPNLSILSQQYIMQVAIFRRSHWPVACRQGREAETWQAPASWKPHVRSLFVRRLGTALPDDGQKMPANQGLESVASCRSRKESRPWPCGRDALRNSSF